MTKTRQSRRKKLETLQLSTCLPLVTYLGGIDDLVGEGLRDRLEASEGGFTGTLADEVDRLVDSAERRHVDGLSADNTAGTDTGGIFASTGVGDGGDDDLDGVLAGQQVNQFEGLLHNSDSHLLFTVVSALGGHEHANDALNNGALGLLEAALLVAASSVRDEHLLTDRRDLEIVGEGVIRALDTGVVPLSEQLGLDSEFGLAVVLLDKTSVV